MIIHTLQLIKSSNETTNEIPIDATPIKPQIKIDLSSRKGTAFQSNTEPRNDIRRLAPGCDLPMALRIVWIQIK
jgi:hypothetical protein